MNIFVNIFVPESGIEPELPTGNSILSATGLPIPPFGHFLFVPTCQRTIVFVFTYII